MEGGQNQIKELIGYRNRGVVGGGCCGEGGEMSDDNFPDLASVVVAWIRANTST